MNSQQVIGTDPVAKINGRSHQCPSCARSFKRPEHLKRHEASHDHQLKFVCRECDKAFSRSDTLTRHRATHKESSLEGSFASAGGRQRACTECAKAREKCTRGQPCRRCSMKMINCLYPESGSGRSNFQTPHESQQMQLDFPDTFGMREPSTNDNGTDSVVAYNSGAHYLTNGTSTKTAEKGRPFMPIRTDQMMSDVSQHQTIDQYNPLLDFDFPLNWLPIDLDTDYGAFGPLPSNDISNDTRGYATDDSHREIQHTNVQTLPALSGLSPNASEKSQSAQSTDLASPGTLYATSTDGARLSSSTRAKLLNSARHFPGTTQISGGCELSGLSSNFMELQFPHIEHIVLDDAPSKDPAALTNISQTTYEAVLQAFKDMCLQPVFRAFQPYISCHFPSRVQLSYFSYLYFERFSATLPVVHTKLISTDSATVMLATAAIGCLYSGVVEFVQCSAPLHEFLRRSLTIEMEHSHDGMMSEDSITAFFLNQLGMTFGLSPRMAALAEAKHGLLVQQCRTRCLLKETKDSQAAASGVTTPELEWKQWLCAERRRRLGYAIFLFDSMLALYDAHPRTITLSEIETTLPNDDLWCLQTEADWTKSARDVKNYIPNLPQAVDILFRAKQVVLKHSHFTQVLLMHGIYNEIDQVREYICRPLSTFHPSAEPSSSISPQRPAEWIVSDRTFSSWRNAACDSIDALHWVANAEIAQLSGIEPPTVFHLHFARTVLLTPYSAIRKVAIFRAGPPDGLEMTATYTTLQDVDRAKMEIVNWIQRDEHKARLAMIHTGCLLWHVRRFSAQAFYEPSALFLTILAIWAYSTYIQQAAYKSQPLDATMIGVQSQIGQVQNLDNLALPSYSTRQPSQSQESRSIDEIDIGDQPSLIRLDRPNDDEMVQLFVRKGRPHIMKAHITGVGDICAKTAPLRIIKEGLRILRSTEGAASCWFRAHWKYCIVLERLERSLSRQGDL